MIDSSSSYVWLKHESKAMTWSSAEAIRLGVNIRFGFGGLNGEVKVFDGYLDRLGQL